MDDSFVKAPVAVPKLSGFDKSHQNLLTSKCGTITPILVDELIPGSKVNLKLALSASLPPLASETYMRCSIKCEAFFVPMRLLVGSFENWFTDDAKRFFTGDDPASVRGFLPVIQGISPGSTSLPDWQNNMGKPGSLSDYLGYRCVNPNSLFYYPITALPFLAYHKIYNDWYRNSLVQNECFLPPVLQAEYGSGFGASPATAPYQFFSDDNSFSYIWNSTNDEFWRLADGHSLFDLRQRNFGLDYFTTATPNPQQGDAQVVTFDTSGATGQFSIATLRAVNSMQQFKERNNLLGNLYVEQLAGRYNVRPSDGIAQRSLYLGRGEFEVYSKGVYQTAPNNENNFGTTNPFGDSVGARFGSAYASGDSFIIKGFEAKEPGYIFVMATLVPRVTYSSGIDKMLEHYIGPGSLSDMANPILQNVGPQPIRERELTGGISDVVFGYTDRYAEFKTKQDSLHGLLRDGQSLESFALQRSFAVSASLGINSDFLQIPTDYLDQVTAVSENLSSYGYWMDCFFDYRVAMPLSKYSLPSLQDPAYEHGRTIVVPKGGSKL